MAGRNSNDESGYVDITDTLAGLANDKEFARVAFTISQISGVRPGGNQYRGTSPYRAAIDPVKVGLSSLSKITRRKIDRIIARNRKVKPKDVKGLVKLKIRRMNPNQYGWVYSISPSHGGEVNLYGYPNRQIYRGRYKNRNKRKAGVKVKVNGEWQVFPRAFYMTKQHQPKENEDGTLTPRGAKTFLYERFGNGRRDIRPLTDKPVNEIQENIGEIRDFITKNAKREIRGGYFAVYRTMKERGRIWEEFDDKGKLKGVRVYQQANYKDVYLEFDVINGRPGDLRRRGGKFGE